MIKYKSFHNESSFREIYDIIEGALNLSIGDLKKIKKYLYNNTRDFLKQKKTTNINENYS